MSTDGAGVFLNYEEWRAILAALDGDSSCRDAAYDALHRRAPEAWLAEDASDE